MFDRNIFLGFDEGEGSKGVRRDCDDSDGDDDEAEELLVIFSSLVAALGRLPPVLQEDGLLQLRLPMLPPPTEWSSGMMIGALT